jgi:NAD(P)-dependent dehydrogenase (short-subunit alcohol dehydrogenase family)
MVDVTKNDFKRVWFITGASRGLGALIARRHCCPWHWT